MRDGTPSAPDAKNWPGAGRIAVIDVIDDGSVRGLGPAESATILAARGAGLIAVIDDLDARRVAQREGVAVAGTVAVLVRLARLGATDPIAVLLERLAAIGFRVSPSVRAWAVEAVPFRPAADVAGG